MHLQLSIQERLPNSTRRHLTGQQLDQLAASPICQHINQPVRALAYVAHAPDLVKQAAFAHDGAGKRLGQLDAVEVAELQ